MGFPPLTTFMPGGAPPSGAKAANGVGMGHTADAKQESTKGVEMDARQAALARLGFGGELASASAVHDRSTLRPRGPGALDLRNRYNSVLPPGMVDFAAQYPLTTVAGIGAVGTTILITSSALTGLALRRLLRGPPARKVDIEGQMADMERRLANEIGGMRAEMRRLQVDGLGGKRSGQADASFQRVIMTRLDRLDQTLGEISQRMAQASPEAHPEETRHYGAIPAIDINEGAAQEKEGILDMLNNPDNTRPADGAKPKRRRKSASKKAVQDPAEPNASEGAEEPIMSLADIAQAIKGVQADYASYSAQDAASASLTDVDRTDALGQHTAAVNQRGDGRTDAVLQPLIAASAPNPAQAEQPDVARAIPVDRIESELASAVNVEMPQAAALDTVTAELSAGHRAQAAATSPAPDQAMADETHGSTRPPSSMTNSAEPRPVDHSQPSKPSDPASEPRPPGHGSDILYGIDDSGCWHVTLPPGNLERGWHWMRTSISFNANDWAEGVGPSYYVSKRSRYTETKPSAIHRIHYNPQPCLIELDHQIWQIAKEGKRWAIHARVGQV